MNYEEKYKEMKKRVLAIGQGYVKEVDYSSPRSIAEYIDPELRKSDDERIREGLIKGLSAMRDIHNHQTFSDDAINIDDAIAWLEKQGEQKPIEQDAETHDLWVYIREWDDKFGRLPKDEDELAACIDYVIKRQNPIWSEEDKEMLKDIISGLKAQKSLIFAHENQGKAQMNARIDWLKSLPERFNLQPKQEWSEEDSTRLYWVIQLLSHVKMYNNASLDTKHIDEDIKWLKSLKPQNRWKPSEQNIKDLEWCADLVKDKMGVGFHRLQVFIDEIKKL